MLPRAGENALDQLRERVQWLEGPEGVAATFDDEGEPTLELDEGDEVVSRPGWVVSPDADDRRVAVSTGDKRPHVLRLTADEDADPPTKRQHKLIGDNEADAATTEPVPAGQGSISVEIINPGANEQAKIVHDPPTAEGVIMHGVCGSLYYFNASGHCIGWYTFAVVPDPHWVWTPLHDAPPPGTGDL